MIRELVSIYMPTKNRPVMLERAITSILEQSYTDFELLVVDDGSSDNTAELLQTFSRQDERIKFFLNPESRGAPFSRNLAIEKAKGKWITGIDDDDWFSPNRIEIFVQYWKLLENAGIDFSGLYSQDIYEGLTTATESEKRGAIKWTDLFEYNSVGNQIFTLTDRIRAVGAFDLGMPAWQDLDLFVRLLKRFGNAKLVDAPLYHLSVDDRHDRISNSGRERLTAAFERLELKHPDVDKKMVQKLYLQLFGKLYKRRPTPAEILKFASYGFDLGNFKRLISGLLRPR